MNDAARARGLDRDRALSIVNAARRAGDRLASVEVEQALESRFGCSSRLAIYGSLAPGESNHHHIANLRGTWEDASVRGRKIDRGWGARTGYPGLELLSGGDEVPVKLFVSDDLPGAWERLDAFEGPDYCRVLTEVVQEGKVTGVANIYELRRP